MAVVPVTPKITNNAPRITMDGQTTFMRQCPECGCVMPHILTDKGPQCVVCLNINKNCGYGNADFDE